MENKLLLQYTRAYTKDEREMFYKATTGISSHDSQILSQACNTISLNQYLTYDMRDYRSFGYLRFGENRVPVVFESLRRSSKLMEGMRMRGESVPYQIHLNMGEVLTSCGYVVDYYRSTEGAEGNHIRVEPYVVGGSRSYVALTEETIASSKGKIFCDTNIVSLQKDKFFQTLEIADNLVSGKQVFLKVNAGVGDSDTIAKWIAASLKLLPPSVANEIGFCTFLPNPSAAMSELKLCGVINGISSSDSIQEEDNRKIFSIDDNGCFNRSLSERFSFIKDYSDFKIWKEKFAKPFYAGEERLSLLDFDLLIKLYKASQNFDSDILFDVIETINKQGGERLKVFARNCFANWITKGTKPIFGDAVRVLKYIQNKRVDLSNYQNNLIISILEKYLKKSKNFSDRLFGWNINLFDYFTDAVIDKFRSIIINESDSMNKIGENLFEVAFPPELGLTFFLETFYRHKNNQTFYLFAQRIAALKVKCSFFSSLFSAIDDLDFLSSLKILEKNVCVEFPMFSQKLYEKYGGDQSFLSDVKSKQIEQAFFSLHLQSFSTTTLNDIVVFYDKANLKFGELKKRATNEFAKLFVEHLETNGFLNSQSNKIEEEVIDKAKKIIVFLKSHLTSSIVVAELETRVKIIQSNKEQREKEESRKKEEIEKQKRLEEEKQLLVAKTANEQKNFDNSFGNTRKQQREKFEKQPKFRKDELDWTIKRDKSRELIFKKIIPSSIILFIAVIMLLAAGFLGFVFACHPTSRWGYDFTFTHSSNNVVITGARNDVRQLTIYSRVRPGGRFANLPVTEIQERAFANHTNLERISLPGDISIGNRAFENASNLIEVIINSIEPNSIVLCENVFYGTDPYMLIMVPYNAYGYFIHPESNWYIYRSRIRRSENH